MAAAAAIGEDETPQEAMDALEDPELRRLKMLEDLERELTRLPSGDPESRKEEADSVDSDVISKGVEAVSIAEQKTTEQTTQHESQNKELTTEAAEDVGAATSVEPNP